MDEAGCAASLTRVFLRSSTNSGGAAGRSGPYPAVRAGIQLGQVRLIHEPAPMVSGLPSVRPRQGSVQLSAPATSTRPWASVAKQASSSKQRPPRSAMPVVAHTRSTVRMGGSACRPASELRTLRAFADVRCMWRLCSWRSCLLTVWRSSLHPGARHRPMLPVRRRTSSEGRKEISPGNFLLLVSLGPSAGRTGPQEADFAGQG